MPYCPHIVTPSDGFFKRKSAIPGRKKLSQTCYNYHMKAAYQDPKTQTQYLKYLDSEDARIEQNRVFDALLELLPPNPETRILDAACGSGWLAGRLTGKFRNVQGVDEAEALIDLAKKKYPALEFLVADLASPLPYQPDHFDVIILNMAVHDLSRLKESLANLHKIQKPGGQLLITLANPYYAFPVGVWKRGLFRFILGMKPRLKLRPYNKFVRAAARAFTWKKSIPSYFHSLPEYLNAALEANYALNCLKEIRSETNSSNFDRNFQLYRFPLVLLLQFKKPAE